MYHHKKPWIRNITEEIEWPNVQNVEQMFQSRRKLGRWLGVQTKLENGCNWKSGFLIAPKVMALSAKC